MLMAGLYSSLCLFSLLASTVSCFAFKNMPAIGSLQRLVSPSPSSYRRKNSDIHQPIQPNKNTRLLATYDDENRLWGRLKVDEDEEPQWYLINCVATMELALLQQCQSVTANMPETDVVKFVVPLERKTRSHGSKKIVTEAKVKYSGYVFAKLRLCAKTYQAIQQLDLCRSWMGTINQKGHRKLPPRPVALSEREIENFGLEELEETDMVELEVASVKTDESGVIFDDDNDDDDDSTTPKVDVEALKVYQGLKVDDMVKVTNRGTFYNEDGVVRRLKDGKIFVRFYTYGQMFEEWLRPTDVRKLKADEILRGLSGPTAPITQQEFDGPQQRRNDNEFQQSARGSRFGNRGQIRNRREDRTADRFRRDNDTRYSNREERENWNWYQDQQRNERLERNDSFQDGSRRITPGSRDWNDRGQRERFSSRDNQVGKRPVQQNRRDSRSIQNQRLNRQNDAAISGQDDWSAFVSNPGDKQTGSKQEPEQDDFFASLMKDLNKDIGVPPLPSETERSRSLTGGSSMAPNDGEDDFFASLLDDLSANDRPPPAKSSSPRGKSDGLTAPKKTAPSSMDDEFFASLEADLESAISTQQFTEESGSAERLEFTERGSSVYGKGADSRARGRKQEISSASNDNDMDDFFASLEAKLDQDLSTPGAKIKTKDEETLPEEEFIGHFSAQRSDQSQSYSSGPTSAKQASGYGAEKKVKAAQPRTTTQSLDDSSLAKKTVPALKEMLRERGLKVSGKKAELVERLSQAS